MTYAGQIARPGYRVGVNDVWQLPFRVPFLTVTLTFTVNPGVAPLM